MSDDPVSRIHNFVHPPLFVTISITERFSMSEVLLRAKSMSFGPTTKDSMGLTKGFAAIFARTEIDEFSPLQIVNNYYITNSCVYFDSLRSYFYFFCL